MTSIDWRLFLGVVSASLAGSFHCVAMCGSLAAIASTQGRNSLLGYQLGRLLGYGLLGALAGALGQAVFAKQAMSELGFAAGVVLGAFLVVLGVRIATGKSDLSGVGAALSGFRKWAYPKAERSGRAWRPLGLGACSVLLPCGWLYSFVWVALATENPVKGALVLLSFWMGTLPWMMGSGWLFDWLNRCLNQRLRSRRWLNGAVALLVIGVGMLSIAQKLSFRVAKNIPHNLHSSQSCH